MIFDPNIKSIVSRFQVDKKTEESEIELFLLNFSYKVSKLTTQNRQKVEIFGEICQNPLESIYI